MNKNGDCPVSRLKIVIITIIILLAMTGACVGLIFRTYKPYYEVYTGDKFLGYYLSTEEYENLYTQLTDCTQEQYETAKYFKDNISIKKIYIKEKVIKKFNNNELMQNALITDYTFYQIVINDETKIYTKSNKEAEELIETFKDKIKDTTKVEIVPIVVQDPTSLELTDNYENSCQQIINENRKVVTSRGGVSRVSSADKYNLVWPTTSQSITSYYGARWGSTHTGIDIGIPIGTSILASADGTVTYSGWRGNYGYYVSIDHGNGAVTAYAHNSELLVKVGDQVSKGQIIALSGSTGNSTGPHLHFEVIINGNFQNPLSFL